MRNGAASLPPRGSRFDGPSVGTDRRIPLVRRGRPRGPAEPLDLLDVAILEALQRDGRASLRRVAAKVGASVTTVSTRVRGLERTGVLQGFVPLVSVQRLAAVGRSPHCAVLFVAPHDRSRSGVEATARAVAEAPNVCYLFQMVGSPELMAFASTVSERATAQLVEHLATLPGVDAVRPIYIARVHKERPGHPVGEPKSVPTRAVATVRP